MNNLNQINKFILEEVQAGRINKDIAFKLLNQLNQKSDKKPRNDIAIIGIGAKFPDSDSLDQFWENLINEKCSIKELPKERKKLLDKFYKYKAKFNPTFEVCGYLDNIDKFDHNYFGISPAEAACMEPEQRLLLEVAIEAIENAAISVQDIYGSRTGVFVGRDHSVGPLYRTLAEDTDLLTLTGTYSGVLASRISYILNLGGPCMVIDTACSSGLVAIHNACISLKNNECDVALAGGVHINTLGIVNDYMQDIRAKDGVTRTFDNGASGTAWGEGVGVVVLKSLKNAIDDGDNILAVIKGSAVNCDGASNGITAPNSQAQKKVILQAWKDADIHPETISYIETHGTGTILGDPIEIKGLTDAFREYTTRKQFCAIGSVKANTGHMVAASGIISVIKMVLALQHGVLPKSLNFQRPNKYISLKDSPLYINDEASEWKSTDGPRRCGVSSFGFSGTNCHVVIEDAPVREKNVQVRDGAGIFVISAKSLNALQRLIDKYIKFLNNADDNLLSNILYTSAVGRGHYKFRLAIIARNIAELKEKITGLRLNEYIHEKDTGVFFDENKFSSLDKKLKGATIQANEEKRKLIELSDSTLDKIISGYDNSDSIKGLLQELCYHYVKGADVKWEKLYRDKSYSKVELPIYPFEDIPCWIEASYQQNTETSENVQSFYQMKWIRKELAEHSPISTEKPKTILCFLNDKITGEKIISSLRKQGNRVIEVYTGDTAEKKGKDKFFVVNTAEGYCELLKNIDLDDISLVLHMTSIDRADRVMDYNALLDSQETGVESLFHIVREIEHTGHAGNIGIVLLAEYVNEITGEEENICPHNATLFGLGKVITEEHVNLKCRSIDIDRRTDLGIICREIIADNWGNLNQIAYRNGERYAEIFDEVDIQKIGKRQMTFHDNGVYMITGGLGGIGLEVAKHIASGNNVNLVLVNRTKFSHKSEWDKILSENSNSKLIEKINTLRSIEDKGSTVTCFSADVACYEDMQTVMTEIKRLYGKLDGIIHCAGIFDEKLIVRKNESDFRNVIRPKVYGTWILDSLTREEDLDFFVLFSSIVTLSGIEGQGAYTAANAYLDSFQAYKNKQGRNVQTINWGVWKEVGGALEYGANVDWLFKTMTTERGIQAFNTIINADINRIIAVNIDYSNQIIRDYSRFPFLLSQHIKNKISEQQPVITSDGPEYKKTRNVRVIDTIHHCSELEKKIGIIWGEVLGLDEINTVDNFFELGGDSRIAMKMAFCINESVYKGITVGDILKYSTVKEMGQYITSKNGEYRVRGSYIDPVLTAADKEEYYPLSSAQKRLYIINQIDPQNLNYNISLAIKINGKIDNTRLKSVFRKLIQRHESLRTAFKVVNNMPVQFVSENVDFCIEYRQVTQDRMEQTIQDFIKPFDLEKSPLFRVCLLQLDEQEQLLILDIHHIIADAISIDILISDFMALYNGRDLRPLDFQYKDFSVWQNSLLDLPELKKQEEYWLKVFQTEIPILNLQTDYPRPLIQSSAGASITFELDGDRFDKLSNLAVHTGTTLYMVLIAIYNIMLVNYSGQDDIVIGSPVAGRNQANLENIIGMFANTIAIRNKIERNEKFSDLLTKIKFNLLEIYENQDYQFEQLISKLQIKRDMGRNPLFDVVFVYRNDETINVEMQDISFSTYELGVKYSKFDLSLDVVKLGNGIRYNFEYCTDLFKEETIRRMQAHFIHILDQVVKTPHIPINQIDMITEKEKNQIVNSFNNTDASYPEDKTIHEMFEDQVKRTPGNKAVLCGDEALTYEELNYKANQLAYILRKKGIGTNCVIGLMVYRSMEMLISILAVLKAGGAYVPIDPNYPDERKNYILKDCDVEILLTQSFISNVEGFSGEIIYVDDSDIYEGDGKDLKSFAGPKDTAYIIYTSGSTGMPKGVIIEHSALINRLNWMQKMYPIDSKDAVLQKTPYTFDVSVWELLWGLLVGARVCFLEPDGEKDPGKITNAIVKYNISTTHFVPVMLNAYLHYIAILGNVDMLKCLKQVFASGEALTSQHVVMFNRLLYRNNNTRLYNLYGPTEAAIDVSYFDCTDSFETLEVVPIGKPIDNIKLYILDSNNRLAPIGIAGELCISGVGLSRGYINNPEITADKFINNPIDDGKRLYRTGDLARWLADGNIEFLGRLDHQLKIRGFRIETDEVSSVLNRYEEIQQSVVIGRESSSGSNYLCAYIVSSRELPVQELKEYLSVHLPDYMIPSNFVRVDKIPLTSSGKVDRRRLPKPEDILLSRVNIVHPRNEIEIELADIWATVLNIGKDKIGIDDSFFNLGGDSILLIQVHILIEAKYPGKVSVADLFGQPTIKRLAVYIDEVSQKKQTEKIDLQSVLLPSSFFEVNGYTSETSINFQLDGMLFKQIVQAAQNCGIELNDLLISAFIYLFYQLTDQEEITVQTLFGKQDEFVPICLNLGQFDNIFSLAKGVELKRLNRKNIYSLKNINDSNFKREKDKVIPVICLRNLLTTEDDLLDIFDIIVAFSKQENSIDVFFQFDYRRLNKKSITNFIRGYIRLLEVLFK